MDFFPSNTSEETVIVHYLSTESPVNESTMWAKDMVRDRKVADRYLWLKREIEREVRNMK
jgi:hypothetical protein